MGQEQTMQNKKSVYFLLTLLTALDAAAVRLASAKLATVALDIDS